MTSPRTASAVLLLAATVLSAAEPDTLPNTKPLTAQGDIASDLVAGVDRFLLRQINQSIASRRAYWKYDYSSPAKYDESLAENRKRLAHILGVRDKRQTVNALQFLASTRQSHVLARSKKFAVYAVRWPVLRDMSAEGLLLVPKSPRANVIAIPDADQTPEMIAGLADGIEPQAQFARKLAEAGCQVLIPTLIDRQLQRRRNATLTNREYLYRSAFELGRHLIGYEIQATLAGVDWFQNQPEAKSKVGVFGYGEGGMLALYAGALDTRIKATVVSGHFTSRQRIWDEPLDRNVFGLLERFGDAELATMISPRRLIVEAADGPVVSLPSKGGGPATLTSPTLGAVHAELTRAEGLQSKQPKSWPRIQLVAPQAMGSDATIAHFLKALGVSPPPAAELSKIEVRGKIDAAVRQKRLIHGIDRHNQWLLRESPFVRKAFMKKLDTSSLAKYEQTVEPYRDFFRKEVVGHFDIKRLPFNARTRKVFEKEKWTGYEVVLDVFDDVIAFGILLVPKGIKEGERRPVVVCQHGLEGRPRDVIEGDKRAYHDFAAKLAERGFITFAPQNLYIFRDRFRTLQRKANTIKKTLFSVIVPQHQQIVDWLETLPYVDKKRIAFYGLSYGGKSAMRIPPLVTKYCLSICSADFNEWVRKNASTRHHFSYVWTGEYEIFEWDLGSNFNYAEMAALICPRPFMVERGHFDGVGEDEWVGYEFGKVRHLYAAKLHIPDRCEIEWFYGNYKGIHTINGQGTYDFLHRHLKWPKPK